jgi:hypothetical protein
MQVESRLVRLRYSGHCFICAKELGRGTNAWWHDGRRFVICEGCQELEAVVGKTPPDLRFPSGYAHDWAQRERQQRVRAEEEKVMAAYAALGDEVWDICRERPAAAIWPDGSTGPRIVGRMLDALVPRGIVVLHDVQLRAERRHIDHVVVAPSGIHIIQSEQFIDTKIEVRRSRLLGRREKQLLIGGRDCTSLVEDMRQQVRKIDQLTGSVDAMTGTEITPVLCFVHADWGWPRRRLAFGEIEILWPKVLLRVLNRPGSLGHAQIEELGGRLASRLSYD